jgi:hypothetical protein
MVNSLVLSRVHYFPSPSPLRFLSSRVGLVYSQKPSRAFVHQSAVARATAEPQEFIIPPIFDIFDVPSRLGQSTQFIQSTKSRPRRSADKDVSKNIDSSLPRPPPSTLPPPIIFDGPACPRNSPLLSIKQRVDEAPSPKHASIRQSSTHSTPFLPHDASSALVEVFDGPARLRPFYHKTSKPRKVST